jgi:hypothetical protein
LEEPVRALVLADIPNPVGVVSDIVSGAGGWAFDKVASGIASWILGAVGFFVNGALDFLRTSSRPDVESAWFAGPGSPYAAVRSIAAFLLVGFVFLGLIQGLLNGDVGGMVRRVAGNAPAAVAGMFATTVVVARLLELTDAMSDGVLTSTNSQSLHFLSSFGATVTASSGGFAAVLLGLVAVVAGLLLWVELIVRASLVYVLVAVSPLAFAATLWPAAKGVLRKTVELILAVILSKLVICITLAIGVAAVGGTGTAGVGPGGLAANTGANVASLLVGAVLLGLAAFSPFIVLKLVPVAEAAIVAQGVSRGPWRATQTGMSTAYSASMLTRVAGVGGGGGGDGAGGIPGMAGASGAAGPAGPAGAAGPAAGASASAGATTGGGTAAAGAAAAGPPGAAAAAGVAVVSGAARAARKVADTASSAADGATGPGSPADAPRAPGGDR